MPDSKITINLLMNAAFRDAVRRDILDFLAEVGDGNDLQLLTYGRVAKIISKSMAYVRRELVKPGLLKSVTLPSGDRRIPLKSLREFLDRLLAEGEPETEPETEAPLQIQGPDSEGGGA